MINGKEVYGTGIYSTEANSMIADKVDIEGFLDICISGLPTYADGTTARYLWFYDSGNAPVGGLLGISRTLSQATFPVPTSAKYVSFSIKQRSATAVVDLDTIQVESGTLPSPYVAYKEGIVQINSMDFKAGVNESVPPKTSGKDGLFFGDSITETASISEDGLTYTEGTRSNWPLFAKTHLGITYKNYARSGASYKDQAIVGDVRKSLSAQINMALANGETADIVVVSAGANDGSASLGNYDTAMAKTTLASLDRSLLYEAIRWAMWTIRSNYPNAVCFAATPIHRASSEPINNLNTAIIKMANRYNFIVIDATNESGIVKDFEVVGAQGRYLYDGLHPDVNGQQLMADLYSSVILNYFNH